MPMQLQKLRKIEKATQQKDIKIKSKSLSTDRFQQYLKDIQDNDTN